MKFTRKIFVALLVVLTLLMSVAVLPASAADQPETLYLTPNANWKQDNARFAAYFFGNGETWVSMTDSNGDGIYEVTVPTSKVYPNVIFCRMNPGASANNWNNKWNQTADLTIPTGGPNHYTVKEGTWDKGGGTWSTLGSTCTHANLSAEATCTTAQTCLDCGDPVVSALGHSFNTAHLCTRCNEQASFTVAGSGAHLGTEWDTGNTANDMTYADGVYTKVYTNVAAGSYALKVARDHDWGTAYPSADKTYTVATAGSTVTVTLTGTTVEITVEAPHVHSYFYPCDKVCQECFEESNPDAAHTIVAVEAKDATCTENGNIAYWYCSDCGYAWADEAQTQVTNQMSVVIPAAHSYFYPCDVVCMVCYEETNPDAKHAIAHVEAVAATCYENGNIEYWYCSDCGYAWADEAQTQVTNRMSIVVPAAHAEAKHVEAVAATCYENGNIEYWLCEACGQAWLDEACTQNTNVLSVVLPMAHAEAKHVEAVAATCTENGNIEYWLCEACGQAWLDEACTQNTNVLSVVLPAPGHSFADGACSACGEEDPDYVAPVVNDKLINFSDWAEFPKGTYADGDVVKYNDYFTFIHGKDSRVDGSEKTFDDGFEATLRFGFGGKYKTVDGAPARALQITATSAGTVTVWWVSGGEGRSVDLLNADLDVIATTGTESVAAESKYITTFEIPAAGVYYLCNVVNNNYWFKVELTEKEVVEEPHVNSLVVGDTNKIVVSGNTLNDAGLPIEWVAFVADEKAHYEFIGDNGALAFIFDASFNLLCGGTGKADLEAGTYLVCLGNGAVGEFNVAVTKSEIVVPAHKNALVVGDNKFIVTATELAAYAEYITFTAAEDGKYTFTAAEGSNIVIFVYTDSLESLDWAITNPYVTNNGTGSNSVEANLKAGNYMIVVNYYYGGVVEGEYNINVAQGEYEEGGNDVVVKNSIALGNNTYVLSETLKNIGYEFLLFTAEQDGIYTFSGCSPLTVFLFHTTPYVEGEALDANAPYVWNVGLDALLTDSFEVELKAGIYWVGFRYDGDNVNVLEVPTGEYEIEVTYAEKSEEVDPPVDENPPVDDTIPVEPELNFFEKIWQAILDFFKSIGQFFGNLFGSKE